MPVMKYHVLWPDGVSAVATIAPDGKGNSRFVRLEGTRERLESVLAYKAITAIDAEIRYLATNGKAQLRIEVARE